MVRYVKEGGLKMKRLGLVLAAMAVALLGVAAPAFSYPIDVNPIVGPSDATPEPGAAFTATASNFCPHTTVSFYLNGVFIGTSESNGSGNASIPMVAPLVAGPYEIKAEAANCDAAPRELDVAFSQIVVTDDPGLPDTGSNSGLPLQAGIVLLLAGGGLAAVAARRRRKPASA